ncbi:1,6-anhydro-N-acetylmuramyl-L-alanine amidase AmpD [Leptothrix discophora]|uniref:1,6-anhydro-N-acetylmuramyl-L-alanine amidase AmpD n=1 Tax=Leptothrix discophora TaxID=89 RepID=A0ABT9G742_LEPDI|nr:1,6-anhydro-N-acetylmuramyl-L-alanine amidase AmpD [Leptothrix discophora]MDP4302300.1 1,6-anhydro-N-acetylmuramyl-L-alanine amidase AmpD [Leptothrix discophora]
MKVARRRPGASWRWSAGWHGQARAVPSPNVGTRPAGVAIDLAIVHSISLPPGRYGGEAIERLFTNRLDPTAHASFAALDGLQVSAHFVVRRDGRLLQFVPLQGRAWHAGVSRWRGRDNCNDHSIGIELEGLEGHRFAAVQYRVLAALLRQLVQVVPLQEVVGHEHVAPGRKRDPGPGFDWSRLARRLRGSGLAVYPDEPEMRESARLG